MNFLDILKERVIVFDGAMGSNLQSQNLTIEDWGGAAETVSKVFGTRQFKQGMPPKRKIDRSN